MGAPVAKLMSEVKAKLLRPALTSHYTVEINRPSETFKTGQKFYTDTYVQDVINLSCAEASLPGSSLLTHELQDDYIGVTEKIPYRKLHDDTLSLTFYVNHNYDQIKFFEGWIRYISGEPMVGEPTSDTVAKSTYNYRFRFRKQYVASIFINKFERDYASTYLRYHFLDAFPISINSMPISYDSSQLLKCTVNFSYTRYFLNPTSAPVSPTNPAPQPTDKNPTPPQTPVAPQQFSTTKLSTVVTNEYYNNFGKNAQNATNFADYTKGNVGGPFGEAVG